MKHLLSCSDKDISAFLKAAGEKTYRARQIYDRIFKKSADDFGAMSDLPPQLREKLARHFRIRVLERMPPAVSSDGTVRLNMKAADGAVFPAVLIETGRGKTHTVCLSSQIGCPVGCAFCATGASFVRNLARGEIIESLLSARDYAARVGSRVTGVLFMGQGEPLLNCDNVVGAVSDIISPDKFGFSRRHVVVSTAGIITGIERLAASGSRARLAVSLHCADDDLRKKLLPRCAGKVASLLASARDYARVTDTRPTFECVMIKGVTDTSSRLDELASALKRYFAGNCAVNLIPLNPNARASSLGMSPSDGKAVEGARARLVSRGIFTIIRQNRGADISSACGQLGV